MLLERSFEIYCVAIDLELFIIPLNFSYVPSVVLIDRSKKFSASIRTSWSFLQQLEKKLFIILLNFSYVFYMVFTDRSRKFSASIFTLQYFFQLLEGNILYILFCGWFFQTITQKVLIATLKTISIK